MTENKLVTLVSKIETNTISNALSWEATAETYEFQTTLANFVVRIGEGFDPDDPEHPDYVLKIIDHNGNTMESITNADLVKMEHDATFGQRHPYEVMQSIFKKAKRQALGVDKVIDSILSELE
jgi:hypothetical protein